MTEDELEEAEMHGLGFTGMQVELKGLGYTGGGGGGCCSSSLF